MIRPICASFPRCTPRRGKPARIPHHRKHRRSPVECHILRRGWKRKGRGERAWTRTGGRREEQGKRNERAALKKEGRETTGRRRMRRRGTGGRDGEESTSTACHRGDEKKWKTDIGKRESFLLVSLASPPPPPPSRRFLLASSFDAFHGRIEDMFTLLNGEESRRASTTRISIFKCKKELKCVRAFVGLSLETGPFHVSCSNYASIV